MSPRSKILWRDSKQRCCTCQMVTMRCSSKGRKFFCVWKSTIQAFSRGEVSSSTVCHYINIRCYKKYHVEYYIYRKRAAQICHANDVHCYGDISHGWMSPGGSKSSSYQSRNPKRDVTFGSPEGICMLKQWKIGHFRRRFSSTSKYWVRW